ncbi:hypothetical protein QW131_06105 [Roseibium salinum]|nr:hypothetical protein [Roseibium salinum]
MSKTERATLASVDVTPSVNPVGKEKNLNARLGRLNSLKRNYNAYINSNDPHLASVVDYIGASIEYQKAQEAFDVLAEEFDAARTSLLASLEGIEGFEDLTVDDLSSEELAADIASQIDALEAELKALGEPVAPEEVVDPAEVTDGEEVVDPVEELTTEEQIAALQAEIDTLNGILESPEFTDYQTIEETYSTAEGELAELEADASRGALQDALESMINNDRPVDDEMVDWATEVLEGKTQEIREATEETGDETDPLATDDVADTEGSDTSDPEVLEEELRLTDAGQ